MTWPARPPRFTLRGVAALIVAAGLLFPVALASPATAAKTGLVSVTRLSGPDALCQDVVFIGARGSGEGRAGDYGMGAKVNTAFRAWRSRVRDRRVAYYAMQYPARDVMVLTQNPRRYFKGLEDGVKEVRDLLRKRASQCPREKWVLAGYSQGAMVMHRAIWKVPARKRILGVIAIADGDRRRGEGAHRAGTAGDNWGITWLAPDWHGARVFTKAQRLPRIFRKRGNFLSVCDHRDIVCGPKVTWPCLMIGCAPYQIARGVQLHAGHYTGRKSPTAYAGRLIGDRTMKQTKKSLPMQVSNPHPTRAVAEETYAWDFDARYGGGGYTFRLTEKSQTPFGMKLREDGVLSGAPSMPPNGDYWDFTLRVTDRNGQSNTRYIRLGVDPAVAHPDTSPTRQVTEGNRDSMAPSISGNGRYIAFRSYASDLVPGDTNPAADIFIHDTDTGDTRQITAGAGDSSAPAISGDGRSVAYMKDTGTIVAHQELFVFDASSGSTRRITVGNGDSSDPAISGDGRYVAFSSWASDLVAGDSNGKTDVFVYDTTTSATRQITHGNADSVARAVSGDGRYVAFSSWASDLVPGDTNGVADVFVYDTTDGTVRQVTHGNGDSWVAAMSPDGRHIALQSSASDLVSGDFNGVVDVFVHDARLDVTRRLTDGNGASMTPGISGDGRYVAFASWASDLAPGDTNTAVDVFVYDTHESTVRQLTHGNADSRGPSISTDGRRVTFESSASDLVPGDTSVRTDVFVWEGEQEG